MDEDPDHRKWVDFLNNSTDDVLLYHAGTQDMTALMVSILRLRNTLQEEEQAIKLLTEKLVSFTKVLVVLTVGVLILTGALVYLEVLPHIPHFNNAPSSKIQTPNVTSIQSPPTIKHKVQKPNAKCNCIKGTINW